jgi:1-acyl-sn-glycerol-3-phosphate acyltransferase
MDSELAAKTVLIAYLFAAAGIILWQAVRNRDGWQVWLLYVIDRAYLGLMLHWRANRRCPIPANGPGLVIANHRSPLDPLIVWNNHHLSEDPRQIRVISFLMAREYYERPIVHWVSLNLRSIPLERDGRDMKPIRDALNILKDGGLVAVFPEGQINREHGMLEGNTGVAWLALKAQVPVYPVYVHNAPHGRNMIEPFLAPARVRVSYGDPVDLSAYYGRRKSQELLREVADLLMQHLALAGAEIDEPPDAADPKETLTMNRETG